MPMITYTAGQDYRDADIVYAVATPGVTLAADHGYRLLHFNDETHTSFVLIDDTTGHDAPVGSNTGETLSYYDTALRADFGDSSARLVLFGGALGDVLIGGSNGDKLNGQNGDDWLIAGASATGDVLIGGRGYDTADFSRATHGIYIGEDGGPQPPHGGEHVKLVESVIGSGYADALYGDDEANRLAGGDGADYLQGNKGDDVLIGGRGDDELKGNGGADLFVFADVDAGVAGGWGHDTVRDFRPGSDRISLAGDGGIAGFGDLTVAAFGSDSAIVTTPRGDSIVLVHVAPQAITAGDFLFAGGTSIAHLQLHASPAGLDMV